MRTVNIIQTGLITTMFATFLLALSSVSIAQDSGDDLDRDRVRDFGQLHPIIKGKIVINKRVYYTGQELEIGVVFRRGARLITEGVADAYVVVFAPGTDLAPAILPVSDMASETRRRIFKVDALDLLDFPAGRYQLGLILTVPGGDPLDVVAWYRKFLGLLDIAGLIITDEALSIDRDGDGIVDQDRDGDGFSDDEDPDTDNASDAGTGNTNNDSGSTSN